MTFRLWQCFYILQSTRPSFLLHCLQNRDKRAKTQRPKYPMIGCKRHIKAFVSLSDINFISFDIARFMQSLIMNALHGTMIRLSKSARTLSICD